jgi:hypothetical protein
MLRLDVTDWRHEEPIINYLHGKTAGDGQMATLNCKALSQQLAPLLHLKLLSVAEERQLLDELQPHFANSSEHTFAFNSMMRGTRSNDAVEHTHQILEEHLGAPVAVGPALKDSGGVAVSGLAFPSLFPLGTGHFEHPRDRSMEWYQWARVLVNFYDGRFAIHSTFPYFCSILFTDSSHLTMPACSCKGTTDLTAKHGRNWKRLPSKTRSTPSKRCLQLLPICKTAMGIGKSKK